MSTKNLCFKQNTSILSLVFSEKKKYNITSWADPESFPGGGEGRRQTGSKNNFVWMGGMSVNIRPIFSNFNI